MRHLQRFLLSLLCAALPLQGIAGVFRMPAPCPMSQAHVLAPVSAAASAADCCEHDDQAGGSKPCKVGQDCPSGGPGLLVSSGATVQRPQALLQPLPARLLAPAFHPSAVWRPPTLI